MRLRSVILGALLGVGILFASDSKANACCRVRTSCCYYYSRCYYYPCYYYPSYKYTYVYTVYKTNDPNPPTYAAQFTDRKAAEDYVKAPAPGGLGGKGYIVP